MDMYVLLSDGQFTTDSLGLSVALVMTSAALEAHIQTQHSVRSHAAFDETARLMVDVTLTCSEMICCRATASVIHVSSTLEAPLSFWPAALFISWSTCLLASAGTAGCEAELASCKTRKVAATAAAVPAVTPQLPCAACRYQTIFASSQQTGLLDTVARINLHEMSLCLVKQPV